MGLKIQTMSPERGYEQSVVRVPTFSPQAVTMTVPVESAAM